ncbi:uncharacterized protein LOC126967592 [Leptidea sinapis]|uniref:uncharacterized protein LOC126967592 n=1 Tax=Leptidea sinapis TaxID=189913 RepID=UPI002130B59F|nr:uncharacterized protein LOC126967592 [Leptidea sinapis]
MSRFLWTAIALVFLLQAVKAETEDEEERFKRQINSLPLIYPFGATYKLIIGFSAPIQTKEKYMSVAFVVNFQYIYSQFSNITQLSRYYFIKEVSREQRDAELAARKDERLVFYKAVADMLEMKGMNGEDCVLRAICESAQYPVEDQGLVGEVLHILMTPDYGRSPFEDEDQDWAMDMSTYTDAATAGREMFNCASIYSKCPQEQGLLDLISFLKDE